MILRIVDNNDHSFSASKTLLAQLLEKLPAALSVEFLLFATDQTGRRASRALAPSYLTLF
jgi:hypothetical protein